MFSDLVRSYMGKLVDSSPELGLHALGRVKTDRARA